MSVSNLQQRRDTLEAQIAALRAELADVNRDLRRALYKASAAAQRLERLSPYGKATWNPPHPALAHEERDE